MQCVCVCVCACVCVCVCVGVCACVFVCERWEFTIHSYYLFLKRISVTLGNVPFLNLALKTCLVKNDKLLFFNQFNNP